jgi:hypothetical protein
VAFGKESCTLPAWDGENSIAASLACAVTQVPANNTAEAPMLINNVLTGIFILTSPMGPLVHAKPFYINQTVFRRIGVGPT